MLNSLQFRYHGQGMLGPQARSSSSKVVFGRSLHVSPARAQASLRSDEKWSLVMLCIKRGAGLRTHVSMVLSNDDMSLGADRPTLRKYIAEVCRVFSDSDSVINNHRRNSVSIVRVRLVYANCGPHI